MARRRSRGRRRSKGMFGGGGGAAGLLGGLNLMDVALMGAGAGLAGVAGAKVNELTGGKLEGNVAQAAAGIGLLVAGRALRMQKFTSPIAKGILAKTIGDFVEDNVAPRLMKTSAPSTSTSNGELF